MRWRDCYEVWGQKREAEELDRGVAVEEGLRDAKLLALKMEKGKKKDCPLDSGKEHGPANTLTLARESWVRLLTYRTGR